MRSTFPRPRPRHPLGLRRWGRRRDERGAVLVEIVMIVPLLLVISLSVFDIGLGWKTSMTITSSVRSAARVASNLGASPSADKSALIAMASSLGSIPTSEIDVVVIFRSTTADGKVPPNCLTATVKAIGGSILDGCNVYSGAEMKNAATATGFDGTCVTSRDRFWCPSLRTTGQAGAGPDSVGVYLKVNHATKTKIFGPTMGIDDTAVMKIEPVAG